MAVSEEVAAAADVELHPHLPHHLVAAAAADAAADAEADAEEVPLHPHHAEEHHLADAEEVAAMLLPHPHLQHLMLKHRLPLQHLATLDHLSEEDMPLVAPVDTPKEEVAVVVIALDQLEAPVDTPRVAAVAVAIAPEEPEVTPKEEVVAAATRAADKEAAMLLADNKEATKAADKEAVTRAADKADTNNRLQPRLRPQLLHHQPLQPLNPIRSNKPAELSKLNNRALAATKSNKEDTRNRLDLTTETSNPLRLLLQLPLHRRPPHPEATMVEDSARLALSKFFAHSLRLSTSVIMISIRFERLGSSVL